MTREKAPTPPRRAVPVLIFLFAAGPPRGYSSAAFLHSSAALNPTPGKQPNSRNIIGEPSLLVAVVASSKLLQYGTNRHCSLLGGQNDIATRHSSSELNRKAKPRRKLGVLLPPRLRLLQQLCNHDSSHCWLVLYFLSAVHLPHKPMVINTIFASSSYLAVHLSLLRYPLSISVSNLTPALCISVYTHGDIDSKQYISDTLDLCKR